MFFDSNPSSGIYFANVFSQLSAGLFILTVSPEG